MFLFIFILGFYLVKIVLASIVLQIAGAKTQKFLILYMQINGKYKNYMA